MASGFASPPVDASTQDPQIVGGAQSCLAQIVGRWVTQDGNLDPTTQRAIQIFQTQAQLPPSGVLDGKTLIALQQACQAQAAAPTGGASGPPAGIAAPSPSEAPTPPQNAPPPGQSEFFDSQDFGGGSFEMEMTENQQTDAVFYQRHPEWKGRSLKNAGRALRAEWINIRDGLVRPRLKSAKPLSVTIPPMPAPTPSVQPAKASPLPSRQQGAGIMGNNKFDNIRKYRSAEFLRALNTQVAFQKVKGFLPWYNKIMTALPEVSIGLDSHGVGNLVFYMSNRAFSDFVESKELVDKVSETIGGGMLTRLEFTLDFIGLLGLGATILDLARQIDNERNVGGVGPQYDKWRSDQALKFLIALLAEDLSRRDLRNSYFVSRNARDLVNEITVDLAEFRPLYYAFLDYLLLEDQLARIAADTGTVPDVLPPEPPSMRPWP